MLEKKTYIQDLLLGEFVRIGEIILGRFVEHVRHRASGGNRIDRNLLVAAIFGETTDERVDGALGSRVERVLGHGKRYRGVGAHEDDAAVLVEVFVRFAGDKELPSSV